MALDLAGTGLEFTTPEELAVYGSMLFYGLPKTGKSLLAASAIEYYGAENVVAIDFEGSMETASVAYPELQVVRITRWVDFEKVSAKLLNDPHGLKCVILDPLSSLQKMLQDRIIEMQRVTQPGTTSNNSMGEPNMLLSDWGVVESKMRKVMEAFHAASFLTLFVTHADRRRDKTGKTVIEPLSEGNHVRPIISRVPSLVGYMEQCKYPDPTTQEETLGVLMHLAPMTDSSVVAGARGKLAKAGGKNMVVPNPTIRKIMERAMA